MKIKKNLAFVMHGLGSSKYGKQIIAFTNNFYEKNFTVVRFDTTNTRGESDGDYADATTTNYYEDLEDVISWASKQKWYQEPFYLIGHSLGSICIALFAEKYSSQIKALAPLSTVISGQWSLDIKSPEVIKKWKETGYQRYTFSDGETLKLKWHHMEDRLKYDLMNNINKLTMPVLMIVGSEDTSTPVEHQQKFFEALPGEKEIHIIKGAEHNFRNENHLQEIKNIFSNWINKVER